MASSAKSHSRFKVKYFLLFILAGVTIGLDQVTKALILEKFRLGETISVIGNYFNITYVQNKGAAFGMLAQANPAFRVPFFVIVPVAALVSIAYIFRKIPDQDRKLAVALSLVIGGAIGNLIDRISLGYVVDFLDFHWQWGYHFPAFNVADSAICVGVGLVILDLFAPEESRSFRKGTRANVSNSN
jgi:signal peptidase II